MKTPFQAQQLANLPGQNLAIGGGFDFWQRGITGSSVNNNSLFLADRWRVQNTATSAVQVDRSTDVPTFAQSGYVSPYSMKLTNSASPASPTTAFVNIRHTLEGFDYQVLHGKAFRIQFWVKSSIVGNYSVSLKNNDGTRTLIRDIVINAANTWERKVIDVTGDTAGTWLFDNQAGLRFVLNLQAPVANRSNAFSNWATDSVANTNFASTSQTGWNATASATFFIAQFAIIPGQYDADTVLPFRRAGRNIQDELAMCQRYYHRPNFEDLTTGCVFACGQAVSGTLAQITHLLPVNMRSNISLTTSNVQVGNGTGAGIAVTGSSIGTNGSQVVLIQYSVASGLTAGQASYVQRAAGSNGFISFDAEL